VIIWLKLMNEKETSLYEVSYLLKPDLREEEVLSFLESLRSFVVDKGGLITLEGRPKEQMLAYPIRKETRAIFNWIEFLLGSERINEIRDYLEKQGLILRYLVVKGKRERKPRKARAKISRRPRRVKVAEKRKPKKPEEKPVIKEEEIDKKLEEILGG
jgi:ribosomal protein S6